MTDKYLPFEQDGVEYNLYEMPKGFVIKSGLDLSSQELTELPDLSEVVVEGTFDCHNNQLTSLEGAPQKVVGYFYCYNNQLTTLKGSPQEVGGSFHCYNNHLISLKGAPQKVGGDFDCDHNQLTSLEGAPQKVGGFFYCRDNQLTSLFGVTPLKEYNLIMCDNSLGEKYGFSYSKVDGLTFEQLSGSALYKSEVAADNVRRKQAQERAEKQQNATAKTKTAFDAWLKNKGIESPER